MRHHHDCREFTRLDLILDGHMTLQRVASDLESVPGLSGVLNPQANALP